MEKYNFKHTIVASLLAAPALAACSVEIDSYHNDTLNVTCDEGRTKSDLEGDGLATFIAHGAKDQDPATITVRRENDEVSVKTEGNVTGPPQTLEEDGYTKPTPIVDGSELSTFGAGGAWVIDVREDSVVIQGSCEGM
jgi:hypothetical protein